MDKQPRSFNILPKQVCTKLETKSKSFGKLLEASNQILQSGVKMDEKTKSSTVATRLEMKDKSFRSILQASMEVTPKWIKSLYLLTHYRMTVVT